MSDQKICVIGLGYVGLPLAVALAKNYEVLGFDISTRRIDELKSGHDSTGEVASPELRSSSLRYTIDAQDIKGKDIYIVTVPTPITDNFEPDLTPLDKASQTVGKALKKGSIVVYESTVYPGVTEDFCAPILEKESGLKCGQDFFLGYSPERINPGDKVHTVHHITKVVAGQNPEVTELLAKVYGTVNNNNIFIAKNIKTAEAAKVIENTQRDINIAFMNEITKIFNRIGISIYDVLDAAKTKWNFLPFSPGLVGGHCIGVDPYYLAHLSVKLHHQPEVILAGRRINEAACEFMADEIHKITAQNFPSKPAKILILGLTFKEDVPDLRNTKVINMIRRLKNYGHHIDVHDPLADVADAKAYYGIDIHSSLDGFNHYDVVVGAVSHEGYKSWNEDVFATILQPKGIVADLKKIWSPELCGPQQIYWSL